MTTSPENPTAPDDSDEPTAFEITGQTESDGTVGAGDHDEDPPRSDTFRYADLTDGDLVELLGLRGIDPTQARSAIAAARSWPGQERDDVTAAVEAAALDGVNWQEPSEKPTEEPTP